MCSITETEAGSRIYRFGTGRWIKKYSNIVAIRERSCPCIYYEYAVPRACGLVGADAGIGGRLIKFYKYCAHG